MPRGTEHVEAPVPVQPSTTDLEEWSGPPVWRQNQEQETAIQESKSEVVHKIDVVAIEVNLLYADLRKVSEGLVQTENNMATLQQEVSKWLDSLLQLPDKDQPQ
ncbi:hypothetical protein NDU88_003788 [Pleurodeles waltl]|uniref:Uncharacterized protein n=1 Tax=Pleurodeles waltl TaxID=8319 RepID=A0AAV7MSW4_PLEWA|nr:hypothetical protein NDU88_003788 [Pleurodeles waltl]